MGKINRPKYICVVTFVLWVIACYGMLAWLYPDYMYKVEELSMFVGISSYWEQCMALPGGLITWCSTFLTSLLYNQYVGAGAITGILLLLQIISIKAFKISRSWWAASVLIPVMPLLSFLRLGYDIFVIKPLGFAFALPLGLIISTSIYWGYRKIKNWMIRCVVVAAIVVVGYQYFGFYALLSALMCGCNNFIPSIRSKAWSGIIPMIVAIITIAIVPQIYFTFVESDLMASLIYLSPLPRFFWSEFTQWGLYLLIFIMMLMVALIAPRWPKISFKVSFGVWALALIGLFVLRCTDKNLMFTLSIDRALNHQEWDKAARMANEIDFEPTRLNTVLGYIAHLRNGTLGDQLFMSKYGWAPYNSTRSGDPMHDAGAAIISYHLGLINFAYRWATEYMIEQGMSAERMKMMVKCALLNYETDLAKYYLDILYNMPNQRTWAKKYLKYASNPFEMSNDKELSAISKLMCQPNIFINDGGTIEGYVWPLLTSVPNGSPEFMELSIYAALINRDLESAMAKIPVFVSRFGNASRAMQEAALFWSKFHQVNCPIEISPAIMTNYDTFNKAFRNTSNMSAEGQREVLRTAFENTLWFYFVFTEDNPIQ